MKTNRKKTLKTIGIICLILIVIIFTNIIVGDFLTGWENPK